MMRNLDLVAFVILGLLDGDFEVSFPALDALLRHRHGDDRGSGRRIRHGFKGGEGHGLTGRHRRLAPDGLDQSGLQRKTPPKIFDGRDGKGFKQFVRHDLDHLGTGAEPFRGRGRHRRMINELSKTCQNKIDDRDEELCK